MRQEQSIQAAFVKLSNQTKLEHKIRLKASIEVARLLLNQGLAFRGHREDESSLNKGNFLEILSWYAKRCDKIGELVLKKAPKNDQMTSHKIQKDIVTACKLETIKAIMEDLNGDYFSLLVDESCDISRKEQMAIVLRYVDRKGSVVERFIGIIHVHDTSALCLKEAIVNYLAQHSLSLSFIRGQCYDGASNMQGRLSGLKVLIQQESKSAHAIHCFAHQLQLTLVGVSKKCLQVGELVLLVSNVLNVVGGSFKRMDELRESQAKKVQVALDMGEVESGKGLNQELGLARAANTRWGSHYKSFKNFISMFGSITDVLDTIVVDSESVEEKAKATGYLKVCQTFEIAFILHLMRDILAITNELNESLQKKEQDIANAILLVKVVKKRLQDLRNEGWDSLVENVFACCVKYDILIPNFDEFYVNFGRSRRKVAEYTISHHYRVEVFFKIIDWQLQELNDRFNEVRTNLLVGVVCLNPVDSFSSFDIKNILRMAELYPDDFGENVMVTLRNQLETYIVDVRDVDKRFSNLKGLGDLSEMLVKVKKHLNYPLVFRLIKFVLLLPVATTTVERAFWAMKLIKSELRNRMDDDFLSSCMVPYVEKRIFNTISDESIMNRFQEMKTRRIEL
ncbi:zinc finger MYM-type protein 1-like [Solanum tuberosum]|uniref:zinc finger MYM-type protein 1-like n=1 Tax=Solanum tuberosum TaxID=4113 RepID=UPI0003D2991D|nr:PREDICTED: zinc finger MYM-type protein 1-like [Solanum tuberosum]